MEDLIVIKESINSYLNLPSVYKAFDGFNIRAYNNLKNTNPEVNYVKDFEDYVKEINPAKFYKVWDFINKLSPEYYFYSNKETTFTSAVTITMPTPLYYQLYSNPWVAQIKNNTEIFVRPIDADIKLLPAMAEKGFNENLKFIWALLQFNLDDPIVFNSLLKFRTFHENQNEEIYEKLKKYGF